MKLAAFTYRSDGAPAQTFEIASRASRPVRAVQLRVRSNYGHASYTCLYRVRVHGDLALPAESVAQ